MSKKLLLSLAPLFAVVAFAVTPAIAQAQLTYGACAPSATPSPNCPAGEEFIAFKTGTAVKVTSKKVPGSGNYKLVAEAGTIECTSLVDKGTVTNKLIGGVLTGTSVLTLEFDGCTFMGCPVQTAGSGAGNIVIVGVKDQVITATTVTVTLPTGGVVIVFSGPPPTGCPAAGTTLGTISGSTTGTQAAKTNILTFAAATGLLFNGKPATITGEDEVETETGAKKVYI